MDLEMKSLKTAPPLNGPEVTKQHQGPLPNTSTKKIRETGPIMDCKPPTPGTTFPKGHTLSLSERSMIRMQYLILSLGPLLILMLSQNTLSPFKPTRLPEGTSRLK